MTLEFTDRVERVSPSATLAISNQASALESEGIDVVDLSVGEPDFDTPENIKDAARTALAAGETGYTPSPGIPELREAIAEKLRADGLDHSAEEVMVTPGGKQALYEVFQTLVDGGDEVALVDPAWVSYEAMTKLAGGSLTRVDTTPYGFRLEPALDDLQATVSDETELLVVNSPGNPHGMVYTDDALRGVRDLAVEHDITVISDEIYQRVIYDGREMTSLGSLPGMGDRTVTLNGFSKAYAMTGWRLGYFAGPAELVEQAGTVHGHSVSCATNFVQHAGVEALRNTDETVAEMTAAFERRRDILVAELADRGVEVPTPEGAFYLMLPVADDDQAWCETAIGEAHVATVPGSAFGTPGYARISYANSTERLQEALDRLDERGLLGAGA
jgi:aspartate aminotransferase